MIRLNNIQCKQILRCKGFNATLKEALNLRYSKAGKVNLSDFSRRAGFTSRSYISELLLSKKGLSKDSLDKICAALNLPKPVSDLVELYAYQDFPSLKSHRMNNVQLREKIEIAKQRIQLLPTAGNKSKVGPRYVSNFILQQVFAGLGNPVSGASIEDVMQRTGLEEKTVIQSVDALLSEQVVRKLPTGNYCVQVNNLEGFGKTAKDGLSDLIFDVSNEIRNGRNRLIDDPTSLCFYTTFSTNESRLGEFRKRMQTVMSELLDEFQIDDGDCVRQIFFAQFKAIPSRKPS